MLKGTVIFAAAAVFMAQTAFADDARGQCGDNAYWSFAGGTLTISGTGETYGIDRDFLSWEKPDWAEFEDEIENVVVEEGITSIGRQLFRSSPLKTVSLPHTLESIGYQTFQASALTALTIPSAQTAVNVTSFENCRELAEINIPSALYSEAGELFKKTLWFDNAIEGSEHMMILGDVLVGVKGEDRMEDITVPDRVRVIGKRAFENVKARRVVLPQGLNELGPYSFYDADVFEVSLPDTLRIIGRCAFKNSELGTVSIPEGVTSIADNVFWNCKMLKRAHLPDHMAELPTGLFSDCNALESVNTPAALMKIGNAVFYDCRALKDFHFPDQLFSIGATAFYNTGLTSAILPDSVREIGEGAFKWSEVREVRLPDKLKTVPAEIFERTNIDEVILPEGVEEIGKSAFTGCKSLKSINFPDSLKHIRDHAFSGCAELDPPPLNEGIDDVGRGAFSETAAVKVRVNPGTKYDAAAYSGCKSLTEAVFDEGCQAVSSSMFSRCDSLASVTLPESLTNINEHGFYGCKALKAINIPASVSTIGNDAFSESGLREITLPNEMMLIEFGCFDSCEELKRVELPAKLEMIEMQAFKGCSALEEIDLPKTVRYIGMGAFNNCTSLKKADLPPALTNVGYDTFRNCPLEEVYIPEGVTEIGDYSFSNTRELHIPPSVAKIGYGALPKNGAVYAQPGSYAYGFAVKRGITPIADYQRQVGDVVDHIVPSDIYVTINGELMPSYCISGKTVVLLRDLERHGFDVWFDEANKRANADFNAEKPIAPGGSVWLANDEILYTDIVGVVNGTELECVNTNGYIGIEAERLGNYAPDISCVWQPEYRRLQMLAFEGMASFDDLVNAISDRKGIERGEGCASFADTDNSRYEVFAQRGYISRADYNGYIYPMRGLRMSDFVLTAGRAYFGTGMDYNGHSSYGSGLYKELRGSYVPSYLTEYMNYMYDAGIIVPDENRSVYLDGILTREQMDYYLDVIDALRGE